MDLRKQVADAILDYRDATPFDEYAAADRILSLPRIKEALAYRAGLASSPDEYRSFATGTRTDG